MPQAAIQNIPVPLRLSASADDSLAQLWVIRDEALTWLTGFTRGLSGSLLGRFSFAVSRDESGTFVVLRIAIGKEPPPVLVDLPPGYCSLLKLENLFIPCGRRLAPLPRRDTLRRRLSADPQTLTWLRPLEEGRFQSESLPLASFRPLATWVEHAIDEPALSHAAWRQSVGSSLAFERFVESPETPRRSKPASVPAAAPPRQSTRDAPATQKSKKPTRVSLLRRVLNRLKRLRKHTEPPPLETPLEPAAIPMEQAVETAFRFLQGRPLEPQARLSDALERVKTLESRCLNALGKLTPGERLEIWPELASAYVQAGNFSEGALCWLNALWERDERTPLWAWGWLRAESAQAHWDPHNLRISDWLAATPTPARARAVAAYVVWAASQEASPRGFRANLGRLQSYLEEHEAHLPLRGAWLARSALVRSSAGDVLALARTRDRLFERLHRGGLSLEIDAPAFIRFAESGDPDRFNRVRKWLTDKRRLIQDWIERLGPATADGALVECGLQAEVSGTRAYADLMLAWALVRLGEKSKAAALRDEACKSLDDADPIHAILKEAFDFRLWPGP